MIVCISYFLVFNIGKIVCSDCRPALFGSMGCNQKKFYASLVVPPVPLRVPSQRPLALSVTSNHVCHKRDNDIIPKVVHRSPGIYVTAEANLRIPYFLRSYVVVGTTTVDRFRPSVLSEIF